jgi:hypothetical protein
MLRPHQETIALSVPTPHASLSLFSSHTPSSAPPRGEVLISAERAQLTPHAAMAAAAAAATPAKCTSTDTVTTNPSTEVSVAAPAPASLNTGVSNFLSTAIPGQNDIPPNEIPPAVGFPLVK